MKEIHDLRLLDKIKEKLRLCKGRNFLRILVEEKGEWKERISIQGVSIQRLKWDNMLRELEKTRRCRLPNASFSRLRWRFNYHFCLIKVAWMISTRRCFWGIQIPEGRLCHSPHKCFFIFLPCSQSGTQ